MREPSSGCAPTISIRLALFLQEQRGAHDGAGGAHRRHEVRDAPFGVAPDLGAGGFVVRERIVGVRELVEDHALAFALHLVGQVARELHAALDRRQHDLGAIGGHALAALDRQILGHDQHHLVAADRRGHRQRDAGIAAGRLDQRVARLDAPALLGLADHRQRRAVLHRAGRVVAFELGQHHVVAGANLVVRQADELHERRVADRVFDSFVSHGRNVIAMPVNPPIVIQRRFDRAGRDRHATARWFTAGANLGRHHAKNPRQAAGNRRAADG